MASREPTTEQELQSIFGATDERVRKLLTDEFHARRFKSGLYTRWAVRIRSAAGLRNVDLDEITQEVAAAAMELVKEWHPGWARQSWEGLAYVRIKTKITSAGDRGKFNGFTGTTTDHRRQRRLRQLKEQMSQTMNAEPSATDVVARHNQIMVETWKDPARSGMIASVDDMRFDSFQAAAIDSVSPFHTQVLDTDDSVLHSAESAELMARVFAAAETIDPQLKVIAETWLGPAAERGEWAYLPPRDIAAQLDIPLSTVRRAMNDIRRIAVDLLYSELGIDADVWLGVAPVA